MRKTKWLAMAMLAALATAASAEVRPGEQAPGFTLQDQNGKQVSLADFAGKTVVLEWFNPQCPFVKRHYKEGTMQSLATKYAGDNVVWLAINSTSNATAAQDKQWVDQHHLSYPILDDSKGKVGQAYGAKTTPHMFVIDKSGKVVYDGAIDNDPDGEKADRVNYVQKALDETLAGNSVSTPETKPYGCGVKYGK
jgi:peroxiredoxin